VVKTFGIFVVIGVLIGTFFASIMKTKMLVLFFSIVVYVFGAYLMLAQEKIKKIKKLKNSFNGKSTYVRGFGIIITK